MNIIDKIDKGLAGFCIGFNTKSLRLIPQLRNLSGVLYFDFNWLGICVCVWEYPESFGGK